MILVIINISYIYFSFSTSEVTVPMAKSVSIEEEDEEAEEETEFSSGNHLAVTIGSGPGAGPGGGGGGGGGGVLNATLYPSTLSVVSAGKSGSLLDTTSVAASTTAITASSIITATTATTITATTTTTTSSERQQDTSINANTSANITLDEDSDGSISDYDLDLDSYRPIRPVSNEHEVTLITPKFSGMSLHYLQCMHHGCTVVRCEVDTNRSMVVCLKLESDNRTLTWQKAPWSALRGSPSPSDYVLKADFDLAMSNMISMRYNTDDDALEALEEGFIDINIVKDVFLGADVSDFAAIGKRYGLENYTPEKNSLSIVYGYNITENKVIHFMSPDMVTRIWYQGLQCLVKANNKIKNQTDKRNHWLKTQYLQLYHENYKGQGPTPAEAIRVCFNFNLRLTSCFILLISKYRM